MAKAISFIVGGAEIAAGIVVELMTSWLNPLGWYLIAAGTGAILGGVGTMLNQPQGGLATAARNPVQPWGVIYGRAVTSGVLVFADASASEHSSPGPT